MAETNEDGISQEMAEVLGLAEGERLHPILSNKEVLEARDRARKKLDKERREAAMRDVEERELHRLRIEEGITTGITGEDARVWVTIDLPEWAPWVAVNGEPFWHGHTYPVSVSQKRSIDEQMQRSWQAHDQAEGRSKSEQLRRRRETVLNGQSGTAVNAPRPFDA